MALTRAKLEELIAAGEIEVGGGGPNPNILHNWDFRNPVNQRRVANQLPAGGYGIDGWVLTSGAALLRSDGILIGSASEITQFWQPIEFVTLLAGKEVTLSAAVVAMGVAGATIRLYGNSGWLGQASVSSTGITSLTVTMPTPLAGLRAYIYCPAGTTVVVESVMLEERNISTLAYSTLMNVSLSLLQCQRYLLPVSLRTVFAGYTNSSGGAILYLTPAVPLRITPTLTGVTEFALYTSAGTQYLPVQSVSMAGATIQVVLTGGTGLTSWASAFGSPRTNGFLVAEL